jgi:serine/threonine-protein kinase
MDSRALLKRSLEVGGSAREDLERRLFRICLVIAGGAAAYGAIDVVSAAWSGPPNPEDPILMGLLALVSGAMAFVARKSRLSRSALMDLAFVYQVVLCGIVSLAEAINSRAAGDSVWGVSWVCVAMVAFPAVLPYRRFPMILAAVMSAISGPLVYVVVTPLQDKGLSLSDAMNMYTPNLITLGIAIAIIMYLAKWVRQIEHAQKMGSYKLVRKIGGGGMGEVWEAKHDTLARPAAIKLIRTDTQHASARGKELENRFYREAQATAALNSAHTVTVYDYGTTRSGDQYYVMELLEGITLQDAVIRFGAMPSGRVAHLLGQACQSLDEAHRAGLFHRDIKPANVFICQKGGDYDFVKILDFGLVKPHMDAETQLTRGSELLGTPGYTPPETIKSGKFDHRSDIYSLGCLGYFLLCGQLLFESEGPVDQSFKHVTETPVPVGERSTAAVNDRLAALIMKCVEKDPDARPQSCAEILAELDAVEEDVPWKRGDARDWWSRHISSAGAAPLGSTRILND